MRIATMKNTTVLLAATAVFIISISVFAEIHSRYYLEYQHNAQEYLRIEVLEVSKDWCFFCSSRDIRAAAKVIEVLRSRNTITVGDIIELRYRYTAPSRGHAGPGTVPLLEKNNIYPAFLNKKDGDTYYLPAAGRYSFAPLDNQAQ